MKGSRLKGRTIRLALVLAVSLLLASCWDTLPEYEGTGFFRVEQTDNRWWLVDPEGHVFYSVGLNHIRCCGYTDRLTGERPYNDAIMAKYGSAQAWRDATVERLFAWGFNTIGAWSDRQGFDPRLAETPVLHLSNGSDDFWDPGFEQRVQAKIASDVQPYINNPNIIGWFTDNEMDWGKDWRSSNPRLDDYLALPVGAPGRAVAETFRGDPDGFLFALASRYYEVTSTALRNADPNHMILGVRASTIATPPEVLQAAGPWIDVFSINHYDLPRVTDTVIYGMFDSTPIDGWLYLWHELSGLPLMITEFTYRSRESDVPNSYPPIYYTFDTQAERAEAYRIFAERSFNSPYIVGHHWFEYFDDPPGGRGDKEDSNFGLVSNADEVYEEMVTMMARVHAYAPHTPQGAVRDSLRRKQKPDLTINVGDSFDVHHISSIDFDTEVPPGRYTFTVDDPFPANGIVYVQLIRNGEAVPGQRAIYSNKVQLNPLTDTSQTFPIIFPGYFTIQIAGTPGRYRYMTMLNIYKTLFDGRHVLNVNGDRKPGAG